MYILVRMNKKETKDKESKAELPTKDEIQQLSAEQFQQLLKDVKKRKYQGISSLMKK